MAQTAKNSSKSNSKSRTTRKSASSSKEAMFSTAVEFDADTRSELIAALQQHLADNHDLYDQTKVAHWNVKGERFWALHQLFDELAEMVHPFTDTLAERITLLGGYARGTVRQTAEATGLEEFPETPQDGETYLRELQQRFAEHAKNSRERAEAVAEQDPSSEDLFIEMSRVLDKALYFIEAHLQDPNRK